MVSAHFIYFKFSHSSCCIIKICSYLCTAFNEKHFYLKRFLVVFGEMAEWSIAAVLKTVELRGSGGSNPSLSAKVKSRNQQLKSC